MSRLDITQTARKKGIVYVVDTPHLTLNCAACGSSSVFIENGADGLLPLSVEANTQNGECEDSVRCFSLPPYGTRSHYTAYSKVRSENSVNQRPRSLPPPTTETPRRISLDCAKSLACRPHAAPRRLTPQGRSFESAPLHPARRRSDSPRRHLRKSKSEADLDSFLSLDTSETRKQHVSVDGTGQDSITIPAFLSSPAMQKAKSPSPSHRILSKRWRNKTKSNPSIGSSMWRPEGFHTWCSVSGRKVVLKPISLLSLSEAERCLLQQIGLAKLQEMNLQCTITIPKETTEVKRPKKSMLALRKRSQSVNLGGLLDNQRQKETRSKVTRLAEYCADSFLSSPSNLDLKDAILMTPVKERSPLHCPVAGLVFGIPLSKCIANDLELRRKQLSYRDLMAEESVQFEGRRKSSSSSQDSYDNRTQNGSSNHPGSRVNDYLRTASNDSLSESESSRNTSSSLIDALSLSTSGQDSLQRNSLTNPPTTNPQVPQIVNVCFNHIETYGLRVLGIFRVGSSKKRTKQLRDEFECGRDVQLNNSHNPHDVGALLKEYFRDLPEPLLTRDLYLPFVATRRIKSKQVQALAVKHLVALLPVPNRDTLWALLKFLWKVAGHSTDVPTDTGEVLPGNKMDSSNLATLFGPNILHKAKTAGEKEYLVESTERAEERKEVIEVIKDMIDHHMRIFEIPPEIHDEILRHLMESDPEMVDQLLKKIASSSGIEPDADTSSSVFEDSDTTSVLQSPTTDFNTFRDSYGNEERSSSSHPCLRSVRSAELTWDKTNFKERRVTSESNRTMSKLLLQRSPSPRPNHSPHSPRPPRLKISKESSSPEIAHVARSSSRGRLLAPESPANTLSIPIPNYLRQNSSPCSLAPRPSIPTHRSVSMSCGSWSSSTSPLLRNNSPQSQRKALFQTSSLQRPLDISSSHDPPLGSAEWQRERWRHWEMLASENADDSYEQETLV